MSMYMINILIIIATSGLLAYGAVCFFITLKGNKKNAEGSLEQFSTNQLEYITTEDNLAFPLQMIDFPKEK